MTLARRLARLERIVANLNHAYALGNVPQPLTAEDQAWVNEQNKRNHSMEMSQTAPHLHALENVAHVLGCLRTGR